MGLKISKKENTVVKIIFFAVLGLIILALLKVMIWENWYYQTKSSEIRKPQQAVITDIVDAVGTVEVKPTAQEYEAYQTAASYPRYLEIPRLDLKARVEISNANENSMPLPNNVYDVCWYSGSGRPGDNSTILISGLKRGIKQSGAFANLDSLEKDDSIAIVRGDGTRFGYKVEEIRIIDRKNAKDELPSAQKRLKDKETLTLITINRANVSSDYESIIFVRATKQ